MLNTPAGGTLGTDAEATFWCQLFSDKITMNLCDCRRKELVARGGFSCHDCSYGQEGRDGRPS